MSPYILGLESDAPSPDAKDPGMVVSLPSLKGNAPICVELVGENVSLIRGCVCQSASLRRVPAACACVPHRVGRQLGNLVCT